MKFFKVLCISIFFSVCCRGQVTVIDSLKKALATATVDSIKIYLSNELMYHYYEANIDSTLHYAEFALKIARKIQDLNGEGAAVGGVGYALYVSGNYSEALKYYLFAIEKYKLTKNELGLGVMYRNIGQLNRNEENYPQAIDYYTRAVIHERKDKDSSVSIRYAYMALGEVYEVLNKLDSATYFIELADTLSSKFNDSSYYGRISDVYGNIALKQHKRDFALRKYQEGEKAYKEEGLLRGISIIYLDISTYYRTYENIDSSIVYAKKALAIADSLSFVYYSLNATSMLSELYRLKHQTDSAYKYLLLNVAQRDSLFNQSKVRQFQLIGFNKQLDDEKIETAKREGEVRVKMFSLIGGIALCCVIVWILWRNNLQQKKSNQQLNLQKEQIGAQNINLAKTLDDLKATQSQLIQAEKMASLGELTAGIAHEIQNPLNFVNNFSEVNLEMNYELKEKLDKLEIGDLEKAEIDEIMINIRENEQKIVHHGKRADVIVKGMLQHSRVNSGQKELTDINSLTAESLRLSYLGFRAKDKTFNAEIKTNLDPTIGSVSVIPGDISRVLVNLLNNAFYSVSEKKKVLMGKYDPAIFVNTGIINDKVRIGIKDNGMGISLNLINKIFQPFFTTKPTGQGTGLGLSLSYDIIKSHGGELKVITTEGEGAEFIVLIPSA